MRAMLALVLHLGGVGECVRLIWGWSDQGQESGDLHTLAATFIMWGNNSQFEKGTVKRKRENLKRETCEVAVDLGANRFPDTSMSCPVSFMVGVWVMFGVVIGPVFGSSIPEISKLVLGSTASKPP
jgi:hypothetical protein